MTRLRWSRRRVVAEKVLPRQYSQDLPVFQYPRNQPPSSLTGYVLRQVLAAQQRLSFAKGALSYRLGDSSPLWEFG